MSSKSSPLKEAMAAPPAQSAPFIDRVTAWLNGVVEGEDEGAYYALLPAALREASTEEQGRFLTNAFPNVEIAIDSNFMPVLAPYRELDNVDGPANAFFNRRAAGSAVSWRQLLSSRAVPPLKAVPYPPVGQAVGLLAVLAEPAGERQVRRPR
jgi:hypothetical protein